MVTALPRMHVQGFHQNRCRSHKYEGNAGMRYGFVFQLSGVLLFTLQGAIV